MPWEPTDAEISDHDAALLWAESGAQWMTDDMIGVPGALVRRVVGVIAELDRRGAGLAELWGARGLGALAERAASMGLRPAGLVSAGGATRLLRTADEWIALSLARPDDVDSIPAWLEGSVESPADLATGVVSDEWWRSLALIVRERDGRQLVDRAVLLGLPCARVGEVTDPRGVRDERLGEAPGRPLDGAVVADLASLWAGPLCGDILARLGARVVTVESTRRPDGGRLARGFFEALHGRTESVAFDLAARDGQRLLADLLQKVDVVIEGSRPRALEQMGIDARAVVAAGPQVWVSLTAHGRDGGGRQRVGFGDDTAAAGGLVGWVGDEPRLLADAVGDPLAGLTAAAVVLASLEQGGRWLVDVALARVAASATGGWIDRSGVASRRPRPRREPGGPMPLGRDTSAVLAELGLGRTGTGGTSGTV